MKLLETKSELTQLKDVPGLLSCSIKHKIDSTTAALEYSGPKIPKSVWTQVLSFFKWVYDTMHSEAQVRLFVNTQTKTWQAWAFPQQARTGMTAKELDIPEVAEQRKQFSDAEGWIYFGTVHHHCSSGAFQSGVDEGNEKNQDGLHITIGKMDEAMHDMHVRFYLSSLKFDPNMSLFWEIGEEAKKIVPPGVWDQVARYQMCQPSNSPFPDLWRSNVIEVKQVSFVPSGGGEVWRNGEGYGCYAGGNFNGVWWEEGESGMGRGDSDPKTQSQNNKMTRKERREAAKSTEIWKRKELAMEFLKEFCAEQRIEAKDLDAVLTFLNSEPLCVRVTKALAIFGLTMEDLFREHQYQLKYPKTAKQQLSK